MTTREDLVAAGVRLLEEEGLAKLTLRRIATMAGVSHGAPRHYFPTYGALLGAIARVGVDELDEKLRPCFERDDPGEAISLAATCYVLFARTHPEMFELISRHDLLEGQGGQLREVTAPWFEKLNAAFCEVVGEIDAVGASALWSGVHGVAVLYSRRTIEPTSAAQDCQLVLDRVVRAFVPDAVVPVV